MTPDNFTEELLHEWIKVFVVMALLCLIFLVNFIYIISRRKWSSSVDLAMITLTVTLAAFIVLWLAVVLITDAYGDITFYYETRWLDKFTTISAVAMGILYVTVDVRCPATVPYEKMCALPEKLGVPFRLLHCQRALCNDPSSFLLTALRRVYEQETGKDGTPLAIGGGTYARALENGAGFGPQFPDEPSTIHQKDEYISLENIEKLLRIYTAALRALTARDAV